ncbi:tRNA dihydrouridine(16) synthase DusC [Aestuariibacter sp. AA17]|uniref:tRNA-dihydrouridine(16) synthase n=1 Tax=Fluctibacter corallii TaxID=2984329 RepID=A0ABT3A589_9ALTE|nr:tRNA dihydrouridine(16) synthase DusC [Aestuariibacter sp. AA17]MCV2883841.1 tRNA dihydrouridine(16) synthase DusC [Aestuariibacter sp. AA17]
MRIILAPMEGVVDHLMRDMLTRIGGFDLCVTEFIRVVDQCYPNKVFYRMCPELRNGGVTPSGTPVKVQLLGQSPEWLAENAVKAVELGSHGVDLNFGCPAKTVNKNKGGAVLLKEPETLYTIVKAVRDAVPNSHPVTAKMRLGFEDKTLAIENASALASGGADELAIHARTKVEGYKPPAHWHWIQTIKQHVSVPIVANGEVWGKEDADACLLASGCQDLMIGRGALAMPNLAQVIKHGDAPMAWKHVADMLVSYSGYELYGDKGKYYPNRIKQWFGYLKRQYTQAESVFQHIRTLHDPDAIVRILQNV